MGYLSGYGFGIGYVGGLVGIVLFLFAFGWPAEGRFPWGGDVPWEPLGGLDPEQFEQDRIVGPLSAVWYVIFVLPMFLFTPEDFVTRRKPAAAVRQGLAQLALTFRHARKYRNIGIFLLARMFYNDGLNAVFTFGPVYAVAVFGWTGATSALFGLMLLISASGAAFIGGVIDDRIGAKRTLLMSIVCLFGGTFLALSITADSVLFVIPVEPSATGAPFSSLSEWLYLLAGSLVGLGAGPVQSASRSMMARLSPPGMVTEFFGLYAFSGKATAFVAPLLIGVLTAYFGAQQPALLIVLAFFVIGFGLLLLVEETRAESVSEPNAGNAGSR
jgi:UMF1 family MFS transporter